MGQVTLVVEFAIEPGRLDDFKKAARGYIERTSSEVGTLRYDWHISEDGTRCTNLELFEDAGAFAEHDRNVADLAPTIAGVAVIDRFQVIGEATDEVRQRLEGMPASYYRYFDGVDR